MTWHARDLGKPAASPGNIINTADDIPQPALAATPRVALAAQLAAEPEADWTPSPELRRELAHAGLIDDQTWAAYRRLLTRGLIAE